MVSIFPRTESSATLGWQGRKGLEDSNQSKTLKQPELAPWQEACFRMKIGKMEPHSLARCGIFIIISSARTGSTVRLRATGFFEHRPLGGFCWGRKFKLGVGKRIFCHHCCSEHGSAKGQAIRTPFRQERTTCRAPQNEGKGSSVWWIMVGSIFFS